MEGKWTRILVSGRRQRTMLRKEQMKEARVAKQVKRV
jgi:hypothetical protein